MAGPIGTNFGSHLRIHLGMGIEEFHVTSHHHVPTHVPA